VVVDWYELELVVLDDDDDEVDSSRDNRLARIWDVLPPDEPIPAMDMVVLLLTYHPQTCGWAFGQKQSTCQKVILKKAESGVIQLWRLQSWDKGCNSFPGR
jgi:hypothetical protein